MPIITLVIDTKKRITEDPRTVLNRYKEALKNGFVSAYLIKVLIIGAAGVGKTHLLHLLFNETPPDVRRSTSLMERPVQAIQTVLKDSTSFERITDDQLYELLAHSVNDSVKSHPTDCEISRSLHKSSETTISLTVTLQPAIEENKISEVEENLLPHIADSKGASPLKNIDWVYFIDSGGQPQFHQLLPAFMRHTDCTMSNQEPLQHNNLNIFVLRLCDKLSDRPTVEFYEEGNCMHSSTSMQTNMEILRCCAQPIQAADEHGNSRLIVVGTHRDLEHPEETRQHKNKLLQGLLKPCDDGDGYVILSNPPDDVIFSLNTKEPDETDKIVINSLRASILSIRKRMKPQDIPLQWLVFHQELQTLTKNSRNDVISFEKCSEVATKLLMKDDTTAALIFFSSLNVILYYPTVLPDVVFVNSQSLLNIVTNIIKYIVYGTDCSHMNDAVLIKARYKGIVSIKILQWMELDLPQLYQPSMPKAQDLIALFLHLGIVCKVKDDYFMPSLLKGLESKDLDELLSKHPDTVAPCAFHFHDRWLKCGAFASLVTSLLSSKKWQLELDELAQPVCVYSNIIKMRYSEFSLVTLVDYVSHIEIHIHDDNIQMLQEICPKIKLSIMESFPEEKPKFTYVCTCRFSERHVVKFNNAAVKRKQVICSKDSNPCKRIKLDDLGPQPLVWIEGEFFYVYAPLKHTLAFYVYCIINSAAQN